MSNLKGFYVLQVQALIKILALIILSLVTAVHWVCFNQMYIKSLEEKIKRLEGQREWISFIMTHGFPKVPENEEGVTYKERIAELSCRETCGEAGSCRKTGRGEPQGGKAEGSAESS